MIKIIFFDIDGTLLRFGERELTKKTEYALKELNKQNILICFASGRGKKTIPTFKEIKTDMYSTCNGAYCYTNEGIVIYKEPIILEDIKQIIKNASEMNRAISMDNIEYIAANGIDKILAKYFSFGHEEFVKVDNFNDFIKDDIYKIMLSCTIPEREIILKDTKKCKVAAWWDKAIDIVNSDSGKGKACEKILEYYGIKKSEAIAFGDGDSDTEMFSIVGTSIAMGNATDVVKSKATDVCESVNDDGVYNYLVKKSIIKEMK